MLPEGMSPQPTDEQRLRQALSILDNLNADYDIICLGINYTRKEL